MVQQDIKDEWPRVGGLVLLSTLLVTLAYSLLRLDTLTHLKLSISEAFKSGLSWGLYYVLMLACYRDRTSLDPFTSVGRDLCGGDLANVLLVCLCRQLISYSILRGTAELVGCA